MKVSMRVATCVLLILASCACARKTGPELPHCLARRHQFYSRALQRCRSCPKCARGWGLRPAPQDIETIANNIALTCYQCERCEKGRTYSASKGYSRCLPCSNCTALHRLVRRGCKRSKNAVCGQCKPGYHDVFKKIFRSTSGPCQHCSHAVVSTPDCPPTTPVTEVLVPSTISWVPGGTPSELRQPSKSYSKTGRVMQSIVTTVVALLIATAVGVAIWITRRRRTLPSTERHTVKYTDVIQSNPQDTEQPEREEEMVTDGCDVDDQVSTVDQFSQIASEITDLRPLSNHLNVPDVHKTDVKLNQRQKMLIRAIGPRWKELAHLLNVDITKLHLADYDCEGERIHQVLLHWERRFPDHATVSRALEVLRALGENQVAGSLLNSMEMNERQTVL